MNKTIAAWTGLQSPYPPYVNFSVEGDSVRVSVRGVSQDGGPGAHATFDMTSEQFFAFQAAIAAFGQQA
jgi:hypothetical protein